MQILIVGILNILCFLIGAKVGQKVDKGENINLPQINPISIAQELRNKKKTEEMQEQIEAIMHNVEIYDGTSSGQRDVPRR